MDNLLPIIATILALVLSYFGGKWGLPKIYAKIVDGALKGKRVVKEVDEALTAVAESLEDKDLSKDDIVRILKEGKDIYDVIKEISKAKK